MSACPGCGTNVDPLVARELAVTAHGVVAYCSAACRTGQTVPRVTRKPPTTPQILTVAPRRTRAVWLIPLVLAPLAYLAWRVTRPAPNAAAARWGEPDAQPIDARPPDAAPPDAPPPGVVEWRAMAEQVLRLAAVDADRAITQTAMQALSRVGDAEAMAALLAQTTREPPVWASVYALARTGDEAARRQLQTAKASGETQREIWLWRARLGDVTVRPQLMRMVREGARRWDGAAALPFVRPIAEGDLKFLTEVSQEPRPVERQRATIALLGAGQTGLAHEVEGLLDTPVGFAAAQALAHVGEASGARVLVDALASQDTAVGAAWSLRQVMGQPLDERAPMWLPVARAHLLASLRSNDLRRRVAAAEATILLLGPDPAVKYP